MMNSFLISQNVVIGTKVNEKIFKLPLVSLALWLLRSERVLFWHFMLLLVTLIKN